MKKKTKQPFRQNENRRESDSQDVNERKNIASGRCWRMPEHDRRTNRTPYLRKLKEISYGDLGNEIKCGADGYSRLRKLQNRCFVFNLFVVAALVHCPVVAGRQLLVSAAIGLIQQGNGFYLTPAQVNAYIKTAGGCQHQHSKKYGQYGAEMPHAVCKGTEFRPK